jgi:hypothetical protein
LKKELDSANFARILNIAKLKKVLKADSKAIPESKDEQRVLLLQLVCHQYSKLKMEMFFRDELLNMAFNILASLLIKKGHD